MKQEYAHIGLAKICGWFGVTRQAHYQYTTRVEELTIESDLILKQVRRIRLEHPMIGVRKLYVMLENFLFEHQIKIGRDGLFNLLTSHNLLIKRRVSFKKTTNSNHWLKKYPNLIQNIEVIKPNQIWVSDITYWKISVGFVYISLITDVYSHMIVGHSVLATMEAKGPVQALQKAIKKSEKNRTNLIHHSDRGAQYCSAGYVTILEANNIRISMTQSGDPRENAIAERVNGILKNEYLCKEQVTDLIQARKILNKSIDKYNKQRPHMSISNLTPEYVYKKTNGLRTKKLWKTSNRYNLDNPPF